MAILGDIFGEEAALKHGGHMSDQGTVCDRLARSLFVGPVRDSAAFALRTVVDGVYVGSSKARSPIRSPQSRGALTNRWAVRPLVGDDPREVPVGARRVRLVQHGALAPRQTRQLAGHPSYFRRTLCTYRLAVNTLKTTTSDEALVPSHAAVGRANRFHFRRRNGENRYHLLAVELHQVFSVSRFWCQTMLSNRPSPEQGLRRSSGTSFCVGGAGVSKIATPTF